MGEISSSDHVKMKIQAFDSYLDQLKGVLDFLREIKEDAEKQTQSLSQKRKELTRFEKELSELWDKAIAFSQKTEEILLPIRKEKDELEAFHTKIENKIEEKSKEIDSKIADFLYKQTALVSNLNQQIDSFLRLTESLKSNLENQNQKIKHLETENSELQSIIESIKKLLEKQRQDFSATLDELRDKHILNLEKDNADIKSVLNELTEKFKNMKFKKILGL